MAKADQPSPIILAIRELRATDLEIGPEIEQVWAEYNPRIRRAREERGLILAREIEAESKTRQDALWHKREVKYQALQKAVMAALGIDKNQFEVLLGIFAEVSDFGADIKDI
jgi:hypothetical protein